MEICFLYSLEREIFRQAVPKSGKIYCLGVLISLSSSTERNGILYNSQLYETLKTRGTHIAFSLYLCNFRTGIINFNYPFIANKISVQCHHFVRVKICWLFRDYFPCLPESQGSSKMLNSFLTCSKILVLPKR